jgi:capsid protein
MGADRMGPPDEPWADPASEARPYGTRPYGTRPYGTRPYGTRPYGTRDDDDGDDERPYGTRPYGTRPYGTRPYGTRPYGTRPYGTRPYGTRPYGTRPYGTRRDVADGLLDRDEWADDVAELFCAASAVISLGASVVFADCDGETPVPSIEAERGAARYMPTRRSVIDPRPSEDADDEPAALDSEKPTLAASRRILRPRDHELAVKVVVPDDLARDLAERPELAWPLKQDLAEDLARSADRAFLRGQGRPSPEPCGISATAGVVQSQGAPDIAALVQVMGDVRATGEVFRTPGFVLGPDTFNALADEATMPAAGLTLNAARLLTSDSSLLFGYPYAITPAAEDQIYFSADWGEAWIAFDRCFVTIDVSTDAHFQTDETVIRAVSHNDFVLRRPAAFHYRVVP